jgi:23S rRNA (cytidine1920-2'-O)/16S rRNA (cytidine1409-2'-O)-methyltransferase
MDLSFISIKKVIENVLSLLGEKKEIVALIKPQFEAGKDEVGKNGVIKDKIIHIKVIKEIIESAYSLDLSVINLTYSPIKGPAGNIEYLIYLANNTINKSNFSVESIVNNAFDYLNN